MTHMVVGSHFAPEVLPGFLARIRIAADEMRGEHRRLAKRRERADPVGHVRTARAIVRLYSHGPTLRL